jgi:hypothetical protein
MIPAKGPATSHKNGDDLKTKSSVPQSQAPAKKANMSGIPAA